MCNHEKKTSATPEEPASSAWRLIERDKGPNQHLYRVDALLCTLRMALDALQEEESNPDIFNLYTVCIMAEQELSEAFDGLETDLRHIKIE